MRPYKIIIYGSYGYTGKLIVDECKQKNIEVLLAGRNEKLLQLQASEVTLPYETVDINDSLALKELLHKGEVVIHCAGPFKYTAEQMVTACLETKTHYTDITGEYEVFEMLAAYDMQARSAGIVIMPGVGFDVVPSDCLALHLKEQLPDATHLQLAFAMSKGGLSRGTARTSIENLGLGSKIRKDGRMVDLPLGDKVLTINFGPFTRSSLCISWGDIATAWRSTGIPNIEVYMAVPAKTIQMAKLSKWFNWLMRTSVVKNYLRRKIDQKPAGPDEQKREQGRSYLWGKIWNDKKEVRESRLETLSGYALTAKTSVLIAENILKEHKSGYYTPAQYFGSKFILRIESTRLS